MAALPTRCRPRGPLYLVLVLVALAIADLAAASDFADTSAGDSTAQENEASKKGQTIGLVLALLSSVLIGSSFIITKKGLLDASRTHGVASGEHYNYLYNYKWWAGMLTMTLGEAANFAAYSYAPAVLVTPLGAGSVIVGAILASMFLGESLGMEGIIGCTLSIIGSVVIILHAPAEKEPKSVDDILAYAWNPCVTCLMIFKLAPLYGRSNMLIYITICSLVGSISVMACKAFGIALRLTLDGSNQFTRPSTYIFMITVVVAVLVQMNYFNKALDIFSTNRVTPVYYVFFTTATIFASAVLFKSFSPEQTTTRDVVSIFCGFITIFIGVFMLNNKKSAGATNPAQALPTGPTSLAEEQKRSTLIAAASRISLTGNNANGSGTRVRNHAPSLSESHLLRTFDIENGGDDDDEL